MPALANDSVLKETGNPKQWALQTGDYANTRYSTLDAVEEEVLTPQDRAREALLMGLRLAEGIDPARMPVQGGLAAISLTRQ